MRKRSTSSRERLIISGIELFSKYGIEGTSLRSVNYHSGSGNHSAAHYHFSTKESFLSGIVEYVFEVTKEELEQFVADNSEHYVGLELIIFKHISPLLFIFQNRPWGRSGIKFLAAILTSEDDYSIKILNDGLPDFKHGLISNLRYQLPYLSEQELELRVVFMWTNLVFGLASADTLKNTVFGDFSESPDSEKLSSLISYCAGGLTCGENQTSCGENQISRPIDV